MWQFDYNEKPSKYIDSKAKRKEQMTRAKNRRKRKSKK